MIPTDMIRIDHLSVADEPLRFFGRVYLNNEYQDTCDSADAIAGCIRRYIMYQVCRPKYDSFGNVSDVAISSRVLEDADGDTVYETVFGDVKIFVPKKRLMEYRDKIPNILPYRFYMKPPK